MFKINRKVEYALIALKHMSQREKLTTAKEICDIYHTPFDPTSRVLQLMAQDGILKAEHGAHGGYQITRDLSQITFGELITIILGPMEIVNCFHEHSSHCGLTSSCNVISPMLKLNKKVNELFKTVTIQELIESKHSAEKTIRLKPIEKCAP